MAPGEVGKPRGKVHDKPLRGSRPRVDETTRHRRAGFRGSPEKMPRSGAIVGYGCSFFFARVLFMEEFRFMI